MRNLVSVIKQAAMEVYENSNPTKVTFGTIESLRPIKIRIEQKLVIDSRFLILPNFATHKDYLKVSDKVILIQNKGGGGYILLDKVGGDLWFLK